MAKRDGSFILGFKLKRDEETLVEQFNSLFPLRSFFLSLLIYFGGSGADRIVGAIRSGVRRGDADYAAMT